MKAITRTDTLLKVTAGFTVICQDGRDRLEPLNTPTPLNAAAQVVPSGFDARGRSWRMQTGPESHCWDACAMERKGKVAVLRSPLKTHRPA
ncbi:hypothetical protein SKAU_G00079460 [Synaphobranchus kaupii]|uniref:Uncharacterized protein n=1 Tax=Synaphobranchus kaupii TaxID=118154 RepID=A0A9Q1FVD3_SYNKA|nr:hypothetical protein SKAU_G00079460 [Synaphobranchus kaupii]